MPTPGKNFPGQKGYPTPNSAPEETFRRVFVLPNNDEWLGLLMGAVQLLTEEWRYYEWGEFTAAETAAAFNQIILDAYDGVGESMPTPFWDEDSDVDDEEPVETQPWYGYVTNPDAPPDELDFVTEAAIWTITGFLAVATVELGFAPAILFNTVARKLVIPMRRGDLGEIIRIWIDGSEGATVDTTPYAPGDIVRVQVVGDPDEETHQLIIVQQEV